ncbi:ThiF family adenylyltransferase [Chloroflexi bacterium TSY]|nr:ThiF family adenylyltransferase [Chloroflexi bacterium TSY]
MVGFFYHEQLYRGESALQKLGNLQIVLCGAGAVGSNLAENLARQGVQHLTVIDFDRVEEQNIGTQIYGEGDVGAFKVEVLQAELFRSLGIEIVPVVKRLTEQNVSKFLRGADLVVDGFDNHAARLAVSDHCTAFQIPCLHVGLNADYVEIRWNESYQVPHDPEEIGLDTCAYPLARNLILFAVALASEAVLRFVLAKERQDYSFTLGDLCVNRE